MHWNQAASTAFPGCSVLLSKVYSFSRADWVTQCMVGKKGELRGQIINVGHLWPGTPWFSTEAPRKPEKCSRAYVVWWKSYRLWGLGDKDWKLSFWWAVWSGGSSLQSVNFFSWKMEIITMMLPLLPLQSPSWAGMVLRCHFSSLTHVCFQIGKLRYSGISAMIVITHELVTGQGLE